MMKFLEEEKMKGSLIGAICGFVAVIFGIKGILTIVADSVITNIEVGVAVGFVVAVSIGLAGFVLNLVNLRKFKMELRRG